MIKIKAVSFEGKLGVLTGGQVRLAAQIEVNQAPRTVAVEFDFNDVAKSTGTFVTTLLAG